MDAARYLVQAAIEDGDRSGLSEAWDALDSNTELISELVLNMLSYSRQAEPVYERVEPNMLATQVVDLIAPRAQERGARVELELDEAVPDAELDRGAIHRALLNLLTNAIDAGGDGSVRLATRWEPETERIVFRVADGGPGIPEQERDAIFEAFYTTKGSQGTGLGLAVSRKLVEDLGGSIEVESELGQGATFTISLPVRPRSGEGEPQ
jgi:signal transduction histidine kinase